jgi:presenilin-like A22 family membrane protease
MAALFTVSVLLALVSAPTFEAQGAQAFEDPESLANPFIYLGIVVVFTAVVLFVARMGGQRVIQALFLLAVLGTLVYVLDPLLNLVLPPYPAFALASGTAIGLTVLLIVYPEWYIVDAVGVTVAAGAASIFGISFGLLPSLALLVAFAVYDAIAVYQTEHMLDLADNVMALRLPIMLVVPKSRSFSFLEATEGLQDRPEPFSLTDADGREVRLVPRPEGGDEPGMADAMFLGLGDIVIPAVLVVSSYVFLRQPHVASVPTVLGAPGYLVVALATLAGCLLGFGVLMTLVVTGRPQAGLPSLNGGAILGFLLSLVPLYGWAPLLP